MLEASCEMIEAAGMLRRMLTRRSFLQLSMAAAAGLAAPALLAPEQRNAGLPNIGVQLYTVRQEAERNLPATLEAVRRIGYTEVEAYWDIYNHPAAELRRRLRRGCGGSQKRHGFRCALHARAADLASTLEMLADLAALWLFGDAQSV